MKILIVHPNFGVYGGAEYAIVKFIKFLHKQNHEVDLITNVINFKIRRELQNICGLNITNGNDMLTEMSEFIHNNYNNYDVINLYNHPAELSLYPITYPSVLYMNEPPTHVMENGKPSDNEKTAVQSLTTVITNSEANKELIDRLYNVNSKVIRYGVDKQLFNKGNLANPNITKYKIPDNAFVIVHSGWFNPFKNQLASIEAFSKFNKDIPNSYLVLIGETNSPYTPLVYSAINKSQCSKNIIITGMVDRETARDWYYRCNVLLNPCKNQGSFLATYEAISMGKPVIASNTVPDIQLLKKENLCIITDNYYKSLLDVYNGKLSYDMTMAQQWVNNNLTWDSYCNNLFKILSEVSC